MKILNINYHQPPSSGRIRCNMFYDNLMLLPPMKFVICRNGSTNMSYYDPWSKTINIPLTHELNNLQIITSDLRIFWYLQILFIKLIISKRNVSSAPLLMSIQRPLSLGSVSSWDKKDSTLSSSSTKRSISACNSISLSSHCQNGMPMRIQCKKFEFLNTRT